MIAESFERIHRSNLVGMGVLPLQFQDGEDADSFGLDGSESFSIRGVGEHRAAPGREGRGDPRRRQPVPLHRPVPDRYLQRAGILSLGRHPPIRAAETRRLKAWGGLAIALTLLVQAAELRAQQDAADDRPAQRGRARRSL